MLDFVSLSLACWWYFREMQHLRFFFKPEDSTLCDDRSRLPRTNFSDNASWQWQRFFILWFPGNHTACTWFALHSFGKWAHRSRLGFSQSFQTGLHLMVFNSVSVKNSRERLIEFRFWGIKTVAARFGWLGVDQRLNTLFHPSAHFRCQYDLSLWLLVQLTFWCLYMPYHFVLEYMSCDDRFIFSDCTCHWFCFLLR